jgi:DNA-binding transcriptional regulator LsrR (DeoR family)
MRDNIGETFWRAPSAVEFDLETDVNARIAWLYHVEGLTQDAIAQLIGIPRARVMRILTQCRQDGTVQIRVTARLAHCSEAERQLEMKYGLERAIVIPPPQRDESVNALVGMVTGQYLDEILVDGMTVGLGWGETLSASLSQISRRRLENMTVVSLLGGLTEVSAVNPSEFAWRFADRLGARCYMMAAPVFAPDIASRDALIRHPGISKVFGRAERLDLAIVSVGNLSPASTMQKYALLEREEWTSLEQAGAIGDVLCRFMTAAGGLVEHPVNDRVLAVHPRELRAARRLVLASGGWQKAVPMRAAMVLLKPHVVITDLHVAEKLLLARS